MISFISCLLVATLRSSGWFINPKSREELERVVASIALKLHANDTKKIIESDTKEDYKSISTDQEHLIEKRDLNIF